jgi:hypothetical protein
MADTLIPINGLVIGFEDLFGGGDRDYNDYVFVISRSNVVVPEPQTVLLLSIGLAALVLYYRAGRIHKERAAGDSFFESA